MLFKSFAHWLLVGFIILALSVLLLLGTWFGLWGDFLRSVLQDFVEKIFDFYSANKSEVDIFARAFGAVGTALWFIYGLHKAWYYAEVNLPKRLEHYIETKRNEVIVSDRKTTFLEFNDNPTAVIARLAQKQPEIEKTLGVLYKAKHSWEMQKATSLYCAGQHKVALAEQPPSPLAQPNHSAQLREQAIEDFRQAAVLDPTDPTGWESAAVQAEAILDRSRAIDLWSALTQAYEERRNVPEQSRAAYRAALNYWELSRVPGIRDSQKKEYQRQARDLLEDSRQRLRQRADPDWTKQFAQSCELLGRVRIDMPTLPAAMGALREARGAFTILDEQVSVSRVEELIHEAEQKLQQDPGTLQTTEHPDQVLARAYERLGAIFIGNDADITARSKAKRNLHIALGYYEQIEPKPAQDIDRVEQLLNEPWLQRMP